LFSVKNLQINSSTMLKKIKIKIKGGKKKKKTGKQRINNIFFLSKDSGTAL